MRGQIHSREMKASVSRLPEYSIAMPLDEGADPSLLATLVSAKDGPVVTRAVLSHIQFVHVYGMECNITCAGTISVT